MSDHLLIVSIALPADLPPDEARHLAVMLGRLGFGVHGADAPVAGVVVPQNEPALVARQRADHPHSEIVVQVPISVGRTWSEARARADLEPRFDPSYDPARGGLFGAFEDVQEQVLALARAGADRLILDVPLQRDVADLLAQVRALVVGAAPRLRDTAPGRRSEVMETIFYQHGWTPPEGYFDL